ncbi:MAG: RluA family pseudouridine synthase [Pirellulaceae bacterium]
MSSEPIQQRNLAIARATHVLPGSIAYDNLRPVNVSQRFDGLTLLDVVCRSHPHIEHQQWLRWFAAGHLLRDGDVVLPTQRVRGGQQYTHLFPGTVEPDVNASIEVVAEDDALVVVNKPAPLPMHPSGRFNKNTLTSILSLVYRGEKLLPGHRLDANTTGIVLLSRRPDVARQVQAQFESNAVHKIYLARCTGHPNEDRFVCTASIGRQTVGGGSRVIDLANGKPAETHFRVIRRDDDGTSLVEAKPITGRTNQIRIHLWHLGLSIVGDPMYLPRHQLGALQTRSVDDPPMLLHAHRLTLVHPLDQKQVSFEAPLPQVFGF